MTRLWTICLLFVCVALQHVETEEWDYGKNGPRTKAWCKKSAICCKGKRQSPINLNPKIAQFLGNKEMQFYDYDKKIKLIGVNDGHTVKFTQDPKSNYKVQPKISKGGLNATYNFDSFHFHWGSKDFFGSEHFLNGKRYAMELHLVHYRSDFRGLKEAILSNQSNALAVLGVFYKVSPKSYSQAMETISKSLPSIVKPSEKTVSLNYIRMIDLLPQNKNFTFCYSGSLTTPDCNEVVAWTVFGNVNQISKSQISNFRKLKSKTSNLSNNFRPIQTLNKRKLYMSGKIPYL